MKNEGERKVVMEGGSKTGREERVEDAEINRRHDS